jgi:AAA+ superfamily predicted ATPase
MSSQDPLKDLELLVRSRHNVIVLDTAEEDRAESLLRHLADRLGLPLFSWTLTNGLRRIEPETAPPAPQTGGSGRIVPNENLPLHEFEQRVHPNQPVYDTAKPIQALHHVELADIPALYHFRGLGAHLKDALIAEKLRDAAAPFSQRTGAIVLTGTETELPGPLRSMSAQLRLPAPSPDEYRELLRRIVRDITTRTAVSFELTRDDLAHLLNALKGLTLMEAEKVLTKAIIEDGKLSEADIRRVIDAKTAVVEREGLLEYYPAEESMTDIADLAGLKTWLAKRRAILTDPERAREFGLPFPKGVLLLGVPGCGKSLCAKAVSMEWGLPLLKLDPANLYNKYVGESERNFKRAIHAAEKLAPVILWIDEIEKAFATSDGDSDGGPSTRILGTFLSWMQDRNGDVFVFATANDVSRLPPEFLRKGRFDEIFFVDLPNSEARRAVWEIHLRKRNQDPAVFDLPMLITATDGFCGAEIEQVVVSGLYTAFSEQALLSNRILFDEIATTRPLSQTMAERIAHLRSWASERATSAH